MNRYKYNNRNYVKRNYNNSITIIIITITMIIVNVFQKQPDYYMDIKYNKQKIKKELFVINVEIFGYQIKQQLNYGGKMEKNNLI